MLLLCGLRISWVGLSCLSNLFSFSWLGVMFI